MGLAWCLSAGLIMVLAAGCFWVRSRNVSRMVLLGAALLLGMLRSAAAQMVPADHISRLIQPVKKAVVLEGIIVSDPRASRLQTSFIFDGKRVHKTETTGRVRGRVWVRCYLPVSFAKGERWILEGSLCKPAGFWARHAAFLGASAVLVVSKSGQAKKLYGRSFLLQRWSPDAMKKRAGDIFSRYMDPLTAGLYRAMILGEKRLVPPAVKDMMIKTGTWHIMVVSGSHTVFLAAILVMVFKILRVPRRARLGLAIGALVFYCFMTGATSPVVRATVMTVVFLLGFIVERNPVLPHSLALAALVILMVDPQQLFDAGFQLSFLSVFSIAALFPRLTPRGVLEKLSCAPCLAKSFLSGVINGLVVSFSAWVGTAPLIFFLFGNFSPVAVIANTVVAPLAGVVTAAGFALLPIGLVCPKAAPFFAGGASFFMGLFLRVNAFFCR